MALVDYDADFHGLMVMCELAQKEVNFD